MSKATFRIFVAGVITITLLVIGSSCGMAEAFMVEEDHAAVSVKEQAQSWVKELASKPHYSTWLNAEMILSPLGPGTHSWLVLLKQTDKIVGYLVIHAAQDGGFRLGEYGTGSSPLFNEQSLQLSLLQLELINPPNRIERVYQNPLHAAWRITSKHASYYRDAVTGEELPAAIIKDWESNVSSKKWNRHGLSASHAFLTTFGLMASFDPYGRMPWLTKSPLAIVKDDYSSIIGTINQHKEIRYTIVSLNGELRRSWSVIGYDLWEGDQLYLALDSDDDNADRRYVPAKLLVDQGLFYL